MNIKAYPTNNPTPRREWDWRAYVLSQLEPVDVISGKTGVSYRTVIDAKTGKMNRRASIAHCIAKRDRDVTRGLSDTRAKGETL